MSIYYVKPNTIKVTQLPCPITIKGVDAFVIHFNDNFFSITSGDYPLSMLDKSFSEILNAVQKEQIIYMIDDNGTYVQYNFNGGNIFVFAGTAFETYQNNDQTYVYLINITLFISSDNIYFNRTEGYINDYELLINKPYIPENVSDLDNDLNFVEISDLASVATSGDYNDLQNTPNLAAVATSGSYNDLDNKPIIPPVPTNVSAFNNDAGYITGITSGDVTTALGYTPGTSNFSGSYTDLSDKPTIPDDLADLNDDSTHRLVTDTEKTTWNNKSDFSGSYNDLTNLPTLPNGTYIGTSTNWGQNTGVSYLRTSYFQYNQVPQKKGDLVYSTGTRNLHVCGDVTWDSGQNCYKTTPVYIGNFAAPVNADWNSNSGLSQILNKPDLSVYALASDLNNVEDLIPSAATDQNQLADKAFVNSSISNMAANYVTSDAQGDNFATKAALSSGPYYHKGQTYTLTENDYALVESDETKDNATTRYIYDGSQWSFQYIVNDTPFTQSQLDAINSGITANKVSGYDSLVSNVQADWNAQSGLAQILNKPTIPTNTSDLNNDSGFIDNSVNDLTNYPLTTDIQNNKNLAKGIEYIIGTQTADTNAWLGVSTDTGCSSGNLYVGKVIIYHLPTAGTASAATLELTLPDASTTGAKTIHRLASTTVTTTFAAGCDILMVWDGTYWKINAYVDTNSNTIGYQLRTNSTIFINKTGYSSNRYTLLFEVEGGLSGASTTIGTGTSKTSVAFKYIPGGRIKYYSTSGAIANNGEFAANGLWDQYTVNLGYTFNTGSTLTAKKPVYMRCTINNDGTLTPYNSGSPSHPIVQDLPTTADGYAYVYLGEAYSTTNIELYLTHPIYEFKNGVIRQFQYDATGSSTDVRINGTSITSSNIADIKTQSAYNETTNKIATMSDLPSVPTDISAFNNDSGYLTSESDPVFSASAAAGISSGDISNWNGKEDVSNRIDSSTGITNVGTDTEYPTVKAVYDYVPIILYGNSDPNNNDGRDGDLYLKLVQ